MSSMFTTLAQATWKSSCSSRDLVFTPMSSFNFSPYLLWFRKNWRSSKLGVIGAWNGNWNWYFRNSVPELWNWNWQFRNQFQALGVINNCVLNRRVTKFDFLCISFSLCVTKIIVQNVILICIYHYNIVISTCGRRRWRRGWVNIDLAVELNIHLSFVDCISTSVASCVSCRFMYSHFP